LLVKEPTTTNDAPQQGVATTELEDTKMEVDATALDHVIENMTYRLVEPVTTPLSQRRATLMPPPPPIQQTLDTQGTQYSLSFLPINEVGQLRASNSDLKERIGALVEQYYHWKLACIWSVEPPNGLRVQKN
jgi:hypothetical protein